MRIDMKQTKFLSAAIILLAAVACQKEKNTLVEKVVEPQVEEDATFTTISAVTQDADTKAFVDGLQVKWNSNDIIAVADDTDNAVVFQLSEGENTANGTFTGDLGGATLGSYAVYPNGSSTAFVGNMAATDYLSTCVYGKAEVPMYGIKGAGDAYTFANIGGAIKVSYTNVPTQAKKFVIAEVSGSGSEKYITGTVEVDNLDSTPSVDLSGLDGRSVEVTAIPSGDITIVVPLPAQSGYNFNVKLVDDSDNTIPGSEKNANTITITQNKLKPFPVIAIPDAYVMFEERFSASTGNSTGFSGGAGSGTFTADNDGWSAKEDKAYGAGAAAKFGTGSIVGEVETPSISIPEAYRAQPVTLHFKAAAWSGDGTSLSLTVTGATASKTAITIGDASWTEHDITLTSLSETISVKFTPSKRLFLDDVVVFFGPTLPSERALASISYDEHSFNAAVGGAFVAPTLNNPNSISEISYSTSDSDIADVDENTGAVIIGTKTGTVRITATFAGNATYRPASDYYDIEVSDPINVTYWINGSKTVVAAAEGQALNTVLPATPDCGISGYEFAGWSESTVATTDTKPTYTSATEVPALGIELWAVFVKVAMTPIDAGNVTYDSNDWSSRGTSGGGGGYIYSEGGVSFAFENAYEASGHIKVYGSASKITITADRNITGIDVTFTSASNNYLGGDNFAVDKTSGTWSGTPSTSVVLTKNSGTQARVTKFVVSLAAGTKKTYSGYTTTPE